MVFEGTSIRRFDQIIKNIVKEEMNENGYLTYFSQFHMKKCYQFSY